MYGPLVHGIVYVLDLILNMVEVLVIASVLVSWVGADPNNQLVVIVRNLTEPLYRPFRRLTKNLPGPIDWAPMIVILLLVFIKVGILPYIMMLGAGPGSPVGPG